MIAAHDDFDYAELRTATQAVLAGAEMIAAGRDRDVSRPPTAYGRAPERSSPRWSTRPACRALNVGKPDRLMFETALDRLGPGRALVIGDRLDADLAGAAAAGLDGAIVLTGVSTRAEAEDAADAGAGGDRRGPPRARARMRLSVIVNPVAGGGRAGRALPAVQAELRPARARAPRRSATLSLEHARELARDAIDAGEIAVAFGGDGLIGAVAGALAAQRRRARRAAGRPRQRLRALAVGSRSTPVAACAVLATGSRQRLDLGWSAGGRSSGSPAAGSTRSPTGSPTRPSWCAATSSTPTARCARWRDGGRRRSRSPSTAASRARSIGYTVAVANSGRYGGGMLLAPDASLDDGLLDVVIIADMSRLRFLRLLPTVFKGDARPSARG